MNAIQIVVASRGNARFFACSPPDPALAPLERIENPGLGIHERDLVSARAGRVRNANSGQPQALAARSTARELAVERFARAIARRIGAQAAERGYQSVILVAEPRLLGSIRGHLSKASRSRLVASLPLDLVHEDTPALRRRLAPLVKQAAAAAGFPA